MEDDITFPKHTKPPNVPPFFLFVIVCCVCADCILSGVFFESSSGA